MRTRRLFSFALSGTLALIALVALAGGTLASSVMYDGVASPNKVKPEPTPTATATATPVQYDEYYVCKYVGTPGADERLKDGRQPIKVSRSAIKGNFADHVVLIGSTFSDEHGRSFVVGYVGQVPAPTAADCPGYVAPTPTPTEAAATATPTDAAATATPTEAAATATPTGNQEVAGETATARSTDDGTQGVLGETATPKLTTTPAPTSTDGTPTGSGTPLFALLICLTFSALGLAAALGQRRSVRS